MILQANFSGERDTLLTKCNLNKNFQAMNFPQDFTLDLPAFIC